MAAPPSRHRTTSSSVPHRKPSVSVRQAVPNPSGDPVQPPTTRTTTRRPSTADRPTRSNTTSERPSVSSRSGGHSHSRSHSISTRTGHSTTKTTHNTTGLKHSPSVSHHTSSRSAAPHSSSQPHKPRSTMDNVVVKNGVPLDATRVKPTRSMTSAPTPHTLQPPSRSQSTDRLDRQANDKPRKTSPRPPTKKATHVDVIDKLDYSGIGAATFHHDGPFDACAPSRNKNKTRAPMHAFEDVPLQQAEDVNNKNLSPRAQATIMAMRQSPGSSPYAIALNTEVAKNYGQPPSPTYASKKKPSPKKSALAEAWGIAEPEPFEEFSAGRQSGYEQSSGSLSSINNTGTRTGMTTSAYPEYPDSRPLPTRRPSKPMPPPQPIQLYPEFPEGEDPTIMSAAPSAYGARPGAPKRSRSLMQRFRKMRENPNAPAPPEDEPPMPSANEIRLVSQQRAPPVPERAPADAYYAGGVRDKSLPAPPPVANAEYFEKPHVPVSPGGAGITRKASLMRKMKGVMSR